MSDETYKTIMGYLDIIENTLEGIRVYSESKGM